jgi:biotin carboxyl carrier protein
VAAATVILHDNRGEYHATVDGSGDVSVDGAEAIPTRVQAPGEVRLGNDCARLAWTAAAGDTRWVFLDGQAFEFHTRAAQRGRTGGVHASLSAPMPATVVRVEASPGDVIKRGDTVIILEAMKMELPVRAPSDGTVKHVLCKPGDLVQPGVPLIEIE